MSKGRSYCNVRVAYEYSVVLLLSLLYSFFSIIKILLIFSLMVSYCIQFYVPMDFMEPPVQKALERFTAKLPTACIRYENIIEKILLLCFRTTVVIFTGMCPLTTNHVH